MTLLPTIPRRPGFIAQQSGERLVEGAEQVHREDDKDRADHREETGVLELKSPPHGGTGGAHAEHSDPAVRACREQIPSRCGDGSSWRKVEMVMWWRLKKCTLSLLRCWVNIVSMPR